MLKHLRVKLTLLYLLSAVALALAVGGGTYTLISYYFQTTTDQALKVKMGLQFASMDLPLPIDLYTAVRKAGLVITLPATENDQAKGPLFTEKNEGMQESELADIYVLPLSSAGELLKDYSPQVSSFQVNQDSVKKALEVGYDLRTEKLPDGTNVRILSYKAPGESPVQVFQVGRYLTTQKIVLRQLLNTMSILGFIITLFIGGGAWLLAGRTLRPTQVAWEKQRTFVANASHELKAPLTLIRAGTELAMREIGDQKRKELLSDVLADTDHMNKLIEELLLLSRLDANTLQLELQAINIQEFLPPILRQLTLTSTENNISLKEDIHPLQIYADPMRLKQVILILVDNSIRHTPAGGNISITARILNGKANIRVTDDGIGIPTEHLERVFERFFKISRREDRDNKGIGLGLSIARDLIEAQHGSIQLRHNSPKGTIVELNLPLADEPE